MTKQQKQANEEWFDTVRRHLVEGGLLTIPDTGNFIKLEKGKFKPQSFAGMVEIKKIVTEEWFDENVIH